MVEISVLRWFFIRCDDDLANGYTIKIANKRRER